MFYKNKGVIVAIDICNIDDIFKLVEQTKDVNGIVGYKLGKLPVLTFGLYDIIATLRSLTELPVVLDMQKEGNDLPITGQMAINLYRDVGVDAIIVFPHAGPITGTTTLKRCMEVDVAPFLGGGMSHDGYYWGASGFITSNAPFRMYELGFKLGVKYYVLPATKLHHCVSYVKFISQNVDNPKFVFVGIGTQGGVWGDCLELTSGFDTYGIIGRSISENANIREAAERFCQWS